MSSVQDPGELLWKKKIICEQLPFHVPIQALRDYFCEKILNGPPPVWQNTYDAVAGAAKTAYLHDEKVEKGWGGWTLQSHDGDYRSGWFPGHWAIAANQSRKALRGDEKGPGDLKETRPTSICRGPFYELIDQIFKMGFCPHRARITCVPAGQIVQWHVDTPSPETYSARIHVPLITNEGCFFETEDDRFQMKADGSAYIVNINHRHRFVNHGDTHRFHVIVSVFDTRRVTKSLAYPFPHRIQPKKPSHGIHIA